MTSQYSGNYDDVTADIPVEDGLFPYDDVTTHTSHDDVINRNELTEADMYNKLEEKDRDLVLAAQLGKSLLEKNEVLIQEKEKITQEFYEKNELLEQEKHELARKLEMKTRECQNQFVQHEQDMQVVQEELENTRTMLISVEKERNRIQIELNEQNHQLRNQLQKASDAEQQLSVQVQQLRKEFLERYNSANMRIGQLELVEQEVADDEAEIFKLEDDMCSVTSQLKDELTSSQNRIEQLEEELRQRNNEIKRNGEKIENSDNFVLGLQQRIEELQQELVDIQYSNSSIPGAVNASSLLSELEETGVDYDDVIAFHDVTNSTNQQDERKLADDVNGGDGKIFLGIFKFLTSSVESCHLQLIEFKQEIWDSFQKIQTISANLKSHLSQYQTDDEAIIPTSQQANLPSAIQQLSKLVSDVIHTKERKETSKEIVEKLREKNNRLTLERDEAVKEQSQLQMKLAEAKTDLMAVNMQLLEAIQQKLHQQKELEAWQDDMEQMIQKTVNDRNLSNQSFIVGKPNKSANSTSWFSFHRKSVTSPPTVTSPPSETTRHHERSGSGTGVMTWFRSKRVTSQHNSDTSSNHQQISDDNESVTSQPQ